MLSTSKFTSPRVRVADLELDPSAIARSAGDLATHDLPERIRRADVPHLVETGVDAASGAFRDAFAQLPGRQRTSRVRPWIPGLAIAIVLATLALTGWWMARGASLSLARDVERELDEDALERAADEGMPGDGADPRAHAGTAPDGAATGFGAGPVA